MAQSICAGMLEGVPEFGMEDDMTAIMAAKGVIGVRDDRQEVT